MKPGKILFLFMMTIFAGCADEGNPSEWSIVTIDDDFNEGNPGWVAGFADFPANSKDSAAFELRFEYTQVESKLSKRSMMLSGKNLNQDLFMYIKRKVGNLKPNTDYTITFNVELTSDLQLLEFSKGGSVFLKAGATHSEPKGMIEGDRYVMNIDKGDQAGSGEDMVTLGNILEDGTGTAYALINRSNTMANSRYTARTNSNGELWFIIGTDSDVSGTTKVFYTRIKVILSS